MPMAEDDKLIAQDEIEQLLKQARTAAPQSEAPAALAQDEIEALLGAGQQAPARPAAAPVETKPAPEPDSTAARPVRAASAEGAAGDDDAIAPRDVEFLLQQAQEALASVNSPQDPGPLPGLAPFALEDFGGAPASSETATLELIRDVELDVKIELGRTLMHLEDVLRLKRGSVVPLDKLAGDPVDIYVNGRLIARGEVLVLNDNFCVRVAELLSGEAPEGA
jgi:flagellar motor switch protein FliN/FliY